MSASPLGGNIELYQDAKQEWRWRRRAGNGQVIASGEAYKNKGDALNIVERQYPDIPVYEVEAELKEPMVSEPVPPPEDDTA